jgi:hypothetical protein
VQVWRRREEDVPGDEKGYPYRAKLSQIFNLGSKLNELE